MQDQILQLQGKSQFLRSSRHFNCDATLNVIVSFLKERVDGSNHIRCGRAETGFYKV